MKIKEIKKDLDCYQEQVMSKELNSSFIVCGPVASGKTILALLKAIDLEDKGLNYQLIVYTKALYEYILYILKSQNIKIDKNKIFYFEKWEKNKKKDENMDCIIIDESQDFDKKELDSLKASSKNIILFYDKAQQLYDEIGFKENIPTLDEIKKNTN